ncbi:MAG: hypothetical protein ABSA47_16595 [Verrucomicrobiota bacterium]|jgi:hypothetical protein
MNKILLLCGVVALITTAGCVVDRDGRPDPYREHARFERQPEVIVPDPVVVVRPPEIIVQ